MDKYHDNLFYLNLCTMSVHTESCESPNQFKKWGLVHVSDVKFQCPLLVSPKTDKLAGYQIVRRLSTLSSNRYQPFPQGMVITTKPGGNQMFLVGQKQIIWTSFLCTNSVDHPIRWLIQPHANEWLFPATFRDGLSNEAIRAMPPKTDSAANWALVTIASLANWHSLWTLKRFEPAQLQGPRLLCQLSYVRTMKTLPWWFLLANPR